MKNKFRKVILSICFIMLCILNVENIYAEVNSVTTIEKNQSQVSSICTTANNSVDGKEILKYKSSTGKLTFSNAKYSKLSNKNKTKFMETALSATRKSGLGAKVKNKVYNFIADQDSPIASSVRYLQTDASADFVEAKSLIAPFTGPIGTLMGVLCLVIFIFLSLSMLMDIAYLSLPGFQLLLERGETDKRPVGVSNEAWKIVRKVETDKLEESIIFAYLKKRVPVIFCISLCLAYLISGRIYSIIVYIMDAFSV